MTIDEFFRKSSEQREKKGFLSLFKKKDKSVKGFTLFLLTRSDFEAVPATNLTLQRENDNWKLYIVGGQDGEVTQEEIKILEAIHTSDRDDILVMGSEELKTVKTKLFPLDVTII
jgi:hypothetical protein